MTRDTLAIYVHLPYCARRCPYCDFNTYAVRTVPEERYAEALLREAGFSAAQAPWSGRQVSSVFFGGGTPSLFSPDAIGRILDAFARWWGFAPDVEITLEANPGSLEGGGEPRLRGFRSAGVSRLSIGAQSFDARHLATLGRMHSAAETRSAFDAARRAGFDNVSCDLMYGVPGQTLEEWESDVETAIALASEHVSAYCLTYEEGTPMTGMKKAGLLEPADEDTELSMFRLARERFAAAGLERYEISNFAREGRECRHNLAYWSWHDYLGLGAGAHGFAAAVHAGEPAMGHTDAPASTLPDDPALGRSDGPASGRPDGPSWGRRYANIRLPEMYMSARDGAWHASEELLCREMAVGEYLMVRLRLRDGILVRDFEGRFSMLLEEAAPGLAALVAAGFVERNTDSVVLTERGFELGDAVIARLAAG